MEPVCLLYTTFATQEEAVAVVEKLIKEKLAVCANISLPHLAVYPWKGKTAQEQEVAAYIKAPLDRQDALVERLRKLHPYELPCILALPADVTPDYANWLDHP